MSEISEGKWRNALPVKKLKTGKKKMVTVDKKMILIGLQDDNYFATRPFADTCVGHWHGALKSRTTV